MYSNNLLRSPDLGLTAYCEASLRMRLVFNNLHHRSGYGCGLLPSGLLDIWEIAGFR